MKEEEFIGYIPEQWVMLKDDIYAAQRAIRIGLEYNKDAIKTYEASLFDQDGPTRPNQKYLDILKNEKLILEKALEGLSSRYTINSSLKEQK
jgi:hypothetical protein